MAMKFTLTSKEEETVNPMSKIRLDYMNKPFTNSKVPWGSGNQIIEYEGSSFVGCYGAILTQWPTWYTLALLYNTIFI